MVFVVVSVSFLGIWWRGATLSSTNRFESVCSFFLKLLFFGHFQSICFCTYFCDRNFIHFVEDRAANVYIPHFLSSSMKLMFGDAFCKMKIDLVLFVWLTLICTFSFFVVQNHNSYLVIQCHKRKSKQDFMY